MNHFGVAGDICHRADNTLQKTKKEEKAQANQLQDQIDLGGWHLQLALILTLMPTIERFQEALKLVIRYIEKPEKPFRTSRLHGVYVKTLKKYDDAKIAASSLLNREDPHGNPLSENPIYHPAPRDIKSLLACVHNMNQTLRQHQRIFLKVCIHFDLHANISMREIKKRVSDL